MQGELATAAFTASSVAWSQVGRMQLLSPVAGTGSVGRCGNICTQIVAVPSVVKPGEELGSLQTNLHSHKGEHHLTM